MTQPSPLKSFLFAVTVAVPFYIATPSASACPMCKFANEAKQKDEEANRRPQAYMYSILFMLSMPATLLASFSFGFYRLWKREQLNQMLIRKDWPAEFDDDDAAE